MKYNVIGYFLSEGFRNVLKNKKSTISCIGIMCVTMLMFGLFFAIGRNITHMMNNIEDAQAIQVNAKDNITQEQVEKMKEDILKIPGVADVKIVTPEEAYNQVKENLGAEAVEAVEPEIFPYACMVTLKDLEFSDSVREQISKIENFDSMDDKNTITMLAAIGRGVRTVTGIILVILILISVFIISNTIKLTVHARRKEISIMKYVGATNGFIRTPFMIEGIIMGILASAISLGFVGAIYNWCTILVAQNETIQKINGFSMLQFQELFPSLIIVFIILGAGLGIIGSAVSMKKYLDV